MHLLVALDILLAWMTIDARGCPWICTWLVAIGIHLVVQVTILDIQLVLDHLDSTWW